MQRVSLKGIMGLLIVLLCSCNSKNDDIENESCVAGNNGNLTLIASPTHHGAYVKALTAFVKFNTLDYQGNSQANYDLVVQGDSVSNKFNFNNLNCGNYYVYAITLDTTTLDTLRGGIPIQPTITEGEFDVIIHVSE